MYVPILTENCLRGATEIFQLFYTKRDIIWLSYLEQIKLQPTTSGATAAGSHGIIKWDVMTDVL